jgi:hypothetical protein
MTTLAESKVGQKALRNIGVVQTRAAFTELAFANPTSLVKTLRPQPSVLNIPFVITDDGNAARSYDWEILLTSPQTRTIATGTVELAARQQAYLDPLIRLGCSGRTRVSVRLSSGEQIDFWATCVAPPTPAPRGHGAGRPRTVGGSGRTGA